MSVFAIHSRLSQPFVHLSHVPLAQQPRAPQTADSSVCTHSQALHTRPAISRLTTYESLTTSNAGVTSPFSCSPLVWPIPILITRCCPLMSQSQLPFYRGIFTALIQHPSLIVSSINLNRGVAWNTAYKWKKQHSTQKKNTAIQVNSCINTMHGPSHITLQAKTGCPLKLSRVEPGQYLDGSQSSG